MALNPLSREYIEFTHFTLRLKRSDLEILKEIARVESLQTHSDVTVARLIRFSLKQLYPDLFPDETYKGIK
jgi:hypothetical protein